MDLEKVNLFLKEIYWYEQCDKNKGDPCEHIRCKYCVLTFGRGSELSCGREQGVAK